MGSTTIDDVVEASKVSRSQLDRRFEDKPALVRAVVELVGQRTIAGERERLGNVSTFAGLRRWRDAVVKNIALHEGRYGCWLGSLASEVSDQDPIARQMLQSTVQGVGRLFSESSCTGS